jgi:hypothetical protein
MPPWTCRDSSRQVAVKPVQEPAPPGVGQRHLHHRQRQHALDPQEVVGPVADPRPLVVRVPAHLVGLVGEQPERADERLGHPRERRVQDVHDVVALEADHLTVETVEEHRVPGLVLDLRGDVQLLFLAGAEHEDRQLDLDLPLAVVEPGRDGHERLALVLGHLLGPVDLVLGEVQVVDVPPLLEVLAVERGEVRQ